tara:strand:- start:182 stop:349 length:168 start_codon:yes stop_codon:yes gene_type:complete
MEHQLVEELVVEVEIRVQVVVSLRYWEETGVAVVSSALLEPQGVLEENPNHHLVS